MSGEQQLGASGQVSSLYVTNIPPTITETELYGVYSTPDAASRISALRIVRAAGGEAKYAYLNFASPEEALEVLNTMNHKVFGDHEIVLAKNIKPATLSKHANLFVSGFSKPISNKDIFTAFSAYGPIASACIRVRTFDNVQKVFAYVQFETEQAAAAAIAAVQANGLQLPDGTIERVTIGPFISRADRQTHFTNVFVRNFPINFNADQFKMLAEKYGPVTSVYVPAQFAPKPGTQQPSDTGYGFANYASPADAIRAIEGLNTEVVGDKKLEAFKAQARSARKRELEEKSKQYLKSAPRRNNKPFNQGYHHRSGVTQSIFLRGLPADMGIANLTAKLQEFGTILSLNTRPVPPNSFICKFSRPEEATAARDGLSKIYDVQLSFPKPKSHFGYPRRPRYPPRQYRGYPPPFPMYGFPGAYPPHYGMPHPHPHHPQQHPHHPQQPHRMNTRRQRQATQAPAASPAAMPAPSGPLSDEERQHLGSQLYYKINESEPNVDITSRITGMLLELPADDVRGLVTNPEALRQKIDEAREVLKHAQ